MPPAARLLTPARPSRTMRSVLRTFRKWRRMCLWTCLKTVSTPPPRRSCKPWPSNADWRRTAMPCSLAKKSTPPRAARSGMCCCAPRVMPPRPAPTKRASWPRCTAPWTPCWPTPSRCAPTRPSPISSISALAAPTWGRKWRCWRCRRLRTRVSACTLSATSTATNWTPHWRSCALKARCF